MTKNRKIPELNWDEKGNPIGLESLYMDWTIEVNSAHIDFLLQLIKKDPALKHKLNEFMWSKHGVAWAAFMNDPEFRKSLNR